MFDFLYSIFGFLFRILFDFIGNYGLALLIFTLFFRIILLPSTVKQQKGSAKQVRLQPKIKRIREKYQDYAPQERNAKIQEETNALYQREGYSAMTAGCAPLLLQLPILWGLYGIVREPLKYVLELPVELVNALKEVAVSELGLTGTKAAYAESALIANIDRLLLKIPDTAAQFADEIQKIRDFNFTMFGIDLGAIPTFDTIKNFGSSSTEEKILLVIPLLSFVTSLMTSLLTQARQKKNNPGAQDMMAQQGCMMLMMPFMSLYFTFQFPAGMGMYWILSNVFAFFQTLVLGYTYSPRKLIARQMVEETIDRRSYERTKKIAAKKDAE